MIVRLYVALWKNILESEYETKQHCGIEDKDQETILLMGKQECSTSTYFFPLTLHPLTNK